MNPQENNQPSEPSEPSSQQNVQPSPGSNSLPRVPGYLQGAGPPPSPGQSLHPPGHYQAAPGERVQPGVQGGAVVQNYPTQDDTQRYLSAVKPNASTAMSGVPQPASGSSMPAVDPTQPKSRLTIVIWILVGILSIGLLGFGGYYFFLKSDDSTSNSTESQETANYDDQLKFDINLISAALETYSGDNNGQYPTLRPDEVATFRLYIPDDLKDPRTGQDYVFTTEDPQNDDVQYLLAYTCGEDDQAIPAQNKRGYVLRVLLHDGDPFCKDDR